jgi:hypothetical protein
MSSENVGRVAGTAAAIALLVCLGLLSNRSWSPPLVRALVNSGLPVLAVFSACTRSGQQPASQQKRG